MEFVEVGQGTENCGSPFVGRRRRGEAPSYWREVLAEFARADQSVREFCAQRGLKEPAFYAWRRKLSVGPERVSLRGSGMDRPDRPAAASFVPMQIVDGGRPSWGPSPSLEVVLTNGCVVRVPSRDQIAWLADVIAAVGE